MAAAAAPAAAAAAALVVYSPAPLPAIPRDAAPPNQTREQKLAAWNAASQREYERDLNTDVRDQDGNRIFPQHRSTILLDRRVRGAMIPQVAHYLKPDGTPAIAILLDVLTIDMFNGYENFALADYATSRFPILDMQELETTDGEYLQIIQQNLSQVCGVNPNIGRWMYMSNWFFEGDDSSVPDSYFTNILSYFDVVFERVERMVPHIFVGFRPPYLTRKRILWGYILDKSPNLKCIDMSYIFDAFSYDFVVEFSENIIGFDHGVQIEVNTDISSAFSLFLNPEQIQAKERARMIVSAHNTRRKQRNMFRVLALTPPTYTPPNNPSRRFYNATGDPLIYTKVLGYME